MIIFKGFLSLSVCLSHVPFSLFFSGFDRIHEKWCTGSDADAAAAAYNQLDDFIFYFLSAAPSCYLPTSHSVVSSIGDRFSFFHIISNHKKQNFDLFSLPDRGQTASNGTEKKIRKNNNKRMKTASRSTYPSYRMMVIYVHGTMSPRLLLLLPLSP